MECSLKHFTHWVTLTLIIIVAAGCEDHMSVYKPFPGTDCHQFFESAPGIKPVAQTCASNLAFDFKQCACDWPYNFVCAFWGSTCLSALWWFHSVGAAFTRNLLERFRFPRWREFWTRDIISSCVIWRHAFKLKFRRSKQTWKQSFWGWPLSCGCDVTFRRLRSS